MADALFAARARESEASLSVASAGTGALIGHPSPAEAVELMAERGIDISSHRGQQVTEPLVRRHDLILVMEREHQRYLEGRWPMLKGRVRLLNEKEGAVVDPYKLSRKTYEASLAQIEQGVATWAEMIFS
jgi:protein-tyrosine phosphatase